MPITPSAYINRIRITARCPSLVHVINEEATLIPRVTELNCKGLMRRYDDKEDPLLVRFTGQRNVFRHPPNNGWLLFVMYTMLDRVAQRFSKHRLPLYRSVSRRTLATIAFVNTSTNVKPCSSNKQVSIYTYI
jgi:hypothetical protein